MRSRRPLALMLAGLTSAALILTGPVAAAPVSPAPVHSLPSAVVPPSDDPPEVEQARYAGADRYATAAQVAEAWAGGQPRVFVAAGHDFPDAVLAAAEAGRREAPVLLVRGDRVPSTTRAALARMSPERIEVIGGEVVVSDAVLTELDALAGAGGARRTSGEDQYATSVAISRTHAPGSGSVYLANGESYPDTLAAAAVAGAEGRPLLLTHQASLPEPVRDELTRLDPDEVIVVGGTDAVSEAAASSAGEVGNAPVRRVGGEHRFATAGEVAGEFGTGDLDAFVASGRDFPDALVGGALAAREGAPMILVDRTSVPEDAAHALLRQESGAAHVFGGSAVVSNATAQTVQVMLEDRVLPHWGRPAWRDEFDGTSVDTARWRVRDNDYLNYDYAMIEKEAVTVKDGFLRIRMQELSEPVVRGGKTRYWSTGYLDTIGKAQDRYGRWEFRAKVPTEEGTSRGVWPAFWLRNVGSEGEIDIMEAWGGPTKRHRDANWHGSSTFSLHESTNGGMDKKNWVLEDVLDPGEGPYDTPGDFQVWTLEYTPQHLKVYMNGELTLHVVPTGELVTGVEKDYSWVWGPTFQPNPWAIRLNMQMGDSYWSPDMTPSSLSKMPADFLVDYVRFWRIKP